jgi:hypothetical protein
LLIEDYGLIGDMQAAALVGRGSCGLAVPAPLRFGLVLIVAARAISDAQQQGGAK